jgi:large subunit ribosomal protein L17
MRHLKKGRKFGRERDQRQALMKSLASSFFMLGRIKTTEAKAKELRPYAEKLITRAKKGKRVDRQILQRTLSHEVVKKLLNHASAFTGRNGGYTRIVKLGSRKSDSARMAIIELVK